MNPFERTVLNRHLQSDPSNIRSSLLSKWRYQTSDFADLILVKKIYYTTVGGIWSLLFLSLGSRVRCISEHSFHTREFKLTAIDPTN
jgi:hypothetical protein